MTDISGLRAGVVGTGFLGVVHVQALRLLGVEVAGIVDTFRELYRAVYGAVAAGGPPPDPDYPTFAHGHRANVLGDAIAVSNAERAWAQVPTKEVTG